MKTGRTIFKEAFIAPLLERKRCIVAIVSALAFMSVAQGMFLLLVGPFLKALFGAGIGGEIVSAKDLLPANLLKVLPHLSSFAYTRDQLSRGVPLLLLTAGLIQAGAGYAYHLHQQKLALWLTTRYREKLFGALLAHPYETIVEKSAARWMSVIMNDVLYLQIRFSEIISSLMRDLILIVACLAAIAAVHLPTALILLVLSPFVAAAMGRAGGRIAGFAREWQTRLGTIASAILDVRRRFSFIRAQHGEAWELERFTALNEAYYQMIRRSIFLRSMFAPAVEFLGFLVFAVFIFAASKGWWVAGFDAAMLIQFFAALGLMLRPLRNIGEQLALFHETRGSLAESLQLFATAPQLPEETAARQTPPDRLHIETLQMARARGFTLALDDLVLEAGKAVAIIGPSGAGKSTLIKVLGGLVTPEQWTANFPCSDLASSSAFVSQTPFLFSGTILENLTYGLEHQPSEEQVWQALALVNLQEDVGAMPEALATKISALRGGVSGGQLQRLVIARAILQDRDVWVFDEATSAVDAATEEDITLRAIAYCRERRRRLISVTHRLRWLEAFDEVWFMEHGRITERGRHRDLMEKPRYRQFVTSGEA